MSDYRVILNEHNTLDFLLRDLRIVGAWDDDLFHQHSVRVKLAQDLGALKHQLQRHFTTEESGSYLEEISNRKLSARTTLMELHKEHQPLLDQLTAVEDSLKEHTEHGILPADLKTQLTQLLDMLKSHERKETALLQEVFSV